MVLTKKDIQRMIREKIAEDKSHQQVYDEMNAKIPNREIDLARMVGGEVTLAQQAKYKTWNFVLAGLIALVAISNVILGLIRAGGEWDGAVWFACAIAVACGITVLYLLRWNLSAYLTIDFLAAISLIEISKMSVSFHLDPSKAGEYALIALATYIYTRVGGSFKSVASQYTDAKGQIRARHKVTFRQ